MKGKLPSKLGMVNRLLKEVNEELAYIEEQQRNIERDEKK